MGLTKPELLIEASAAHTFFRRSIGALTEADSTFSPVEGLYTVAAHVAHVAQTVEWFLDGAFSGAGFDMNFEEHIKEAQSYRSLEKALERLDAAFDRLKKEIESRSQAEWDTPFAEGQLLQGPKWNLIGAVTDHTAHHRGALSVYARLLGKVPPMPYM